MGDQPKVRIAERGAAPDCGAYAERLRLIFENSPLAILYTDSEGTITTCNDPASALFGAPRERLIGFSYRQIRDPRMRSAIGSCLEGQRTEFEGEYLTVTGKAQRYLKASFSPSLDGAGRVLGCIGIFEDISARIEMEREKEQLIGELRRALAEVKTLRGILPICASCKKVRDDQGYWKRIEEYMEAHTEAKFTHGVCPESTGRLYPEFARGQGDEE